MKFPTFARFRILGELRDVQRSLVITGWSNDADNAPLVFGLKPDIENIGRVLAPSPIPPSKIT